ncbi:hypothetical protein EVA_09107 [gut metagenome]|uniref:Uncharacterized protein n=1 Tax=gut metagenome TaxID=749906 RepID=J9CRI4_9ZZZZ
MGYGSIHQHGVLFVNRYGGTFQNLQIRICYFSLNIYWISKGISTRNSHTT